MSDATTSNAEASVSCSLLKTGRNAVRSRVIAGVTVPDTPLITAAIEYAQRLSEPYLFHHAMRSWLFAELIGRVRGSAFDREVVALGTILHDIGLTSPVSGTHRFEVNGSLVAQEIQRAAQRPPPALMPTSIASGVTATIADPTADAVAATPGGALTTRSALDLNGQFGRLRTQEFAVVCYAEFLFTRLNGQSMGQRQIAELEMVPIGFSVGCHVNQLAAAGCPASSRTPG